MVNTASLNQTTFAQTSMLHTMFITYLLLCVLLVSWIYAEVDPSKTFGKLI